MIIANIILAVLLTANRLSYRRYYGVGEPDCNCCDCFLAW
jgi:hypothetical protein